MTGTEPYTPSLEEFEVWIDSVVKGQRTGTRDSTNVIAEFRRMIAAHAAAVRQEEREKAALLAEEWDSGEVGRWVAKNIAAQIREGR